MNKPTNPAIDTSVLSWPVGGLENVGACPVCGATERSLLYENLVDDVFRCAPGKWSLWRCSGCESAYLDPRPTPETLHIAYQSYYTHSAGEGRKEFETLGLVRRLRRRLSNGYANWRYKSKREPASVLGVPLAYCLAPLKSVVDRAFRHLPRKEEVCPALLDVGCGNGEFLELAAECGWKAVGVDPDPRAVATAKMLGFQIYEGGVEVFRDKQSLFDFISLSHVIEHLHNPLEMLKTCFELLRPGGTLWIETPNIKSFGHSIYSRSWRGIEAPRHLVLFNENSLRKAIEVAGFVGVSRCSRQSACPGIFKASYAIQKGFSPYTELRLPATMGLSLLSVMLKEAVMPARREFLTFCAVKI